MVELKGRKFGVSLGVIMPGHVIARLNTHDGAEIYLTKSPDGGYRLVSDDPRLEQKMAKADDIMRRYSDTLHVPAQ
ncbi:MAG: AbrB/MazE/SpoVT family DNA-binding domain-containing protein [Pseudochelatococcus sp.]|jgi:antitoxin component of MazEF toxin-antitoxin module|uniref:AbrB/MazE/SpoVT family DNA-binding domain-containing protein n=1 Tax=Pseudochelatococcus sp. TaxID=2020869 RepID=UPI003D93A912